MNSFFQDAVHIWNNIGTDFQTCNKFKMHTLSLICVCSAWMYAFVCIFLHLCQGVGGGGGQWAGRHYFGKIEFFLMVIYPIILISRIKT